MITSVPKLVMLGLPSLFSFFYYLLGYASFCTTVLTAIILTAMMNFILADSDLTLQLLRNYGRSKENLKGKVVWITGASTGIGEACAMKLAAQQCKLILSARSKDKLDNLRKNCIEIGKLDSNDVLVVSFDMLDFDMHQTAFDTAVKHFGKIDILFNNAGTSQRANFTDISSELDKELFNLNVFSLISLARIVTKHFLEVGGGHHVITSSITGRMGVPLSSTYCATKHALHGYFEALRAEHGADGIAITLLIVGPVESNLMALAYGESTENRGFSKRKEKLMSTSRCADLMLTSIVNRLPEAVISIQPAIFLCYFSMYFTTLYQWLQVFINVKKLICKARDQNEKGV